MDNIVDNPAIMDIILLFPLIMFLIVIFFDNKQNPGWLRKTTKIIFVISAIPALVIGWRVVLTVGGIFGSLIFMVWCYDRNERIGK